MAPKVEVFTVEREVASGERVETRFERLWNRLVAAVERLGGAVIPLADDETLHLYDTPSDPERAAALAPPVDVVRARRPAQFAAWLPTGGWLVSVPNHAAVHSFAVLPPRAAAQVTGAMGEPGVSWKSVVAERRAGRSTFPYVVFAAWDVSDVHGWAFGPVPDAAFPGELGVWIVEDGAACVFLGSVEAWLVERIERLEQVTLPSDQDELVEDDLARPLRLNHL